jgi:dihydrofolate reductase
MTLIIIAALNRRRVIASHGLLPWDIPEDLQRFKELTMGHPVLMGRKTFEALERPLEGRRNIVISRQHTSFIGAERTATVEEALRLVHDVETVFLIGGGELFSQMLERADRWMLTIVENDAAGETFFPPFEHLIGTTFTLQSLEQHDGFRYENYVRSDDRPEAR